LPATGRSWTRRPDPGVESLGGIVRSSAMGGLMIAHDDGIVDYHVASGTRRPVVHPLQHRRGVRYNDMKVDPTGRLWLSTADVAEAEPVGGVLTVSGSTWSSFAEGIVVANGPAFSPSGAVAYVSDSTAGSVFAF